MKLICNTDLDNKFIYNRVYVLCKFDVVQDHTNSFFLPAEVIQFGGILSVGSSVMMWYTTLMDLFARFI